MKTSLIFFLLIFTTFSNASECYRYHIPHYYDLFVRNNKIIFQHTVKDINTISFVSQNEIELNNINSDGFNLIEQDDKYILFCNSNDYYIIDLNSYYVKENGTSKIFTTREVKKTLGTSFFYVNNQWVYIDTDHQYKESKNVKLPRLTQNLQIIHKDKDNRRWLLKDDNNYYSFSDRNFKVIPNLNLKTTLFYETKYYYLDKNFLYDENTFYLLDYNYNYQDETANFKLEGSNDNLLEMTFHDTYNDLYLKESDSLIWAYKKNGVNFKDHSSICFYPLKGKFINKYNSLLEINGSVYYDSHSAMYENGSIDISIIENIDLLEKVDYSTFYDGNRHYKYDYDSKRLIKISKSIDKNTILFPSVNFYGRTLSSFYKDKNSINYYNEYELINTRKIKTDVKNLTLAYAYDDVLLIEDKEIPNIADNNTIEFLGSTVDVISDCDGGKGQKNIIIKYFYFFKDKDYIYYYYSDEKEMKIIENLKSNTQDYSNFISLKKLENNCR